MSGQAQPFPEAIDTGAEQSLKGGTARRFFTACQGPSGGHGGSGTVIPFLVSDRSGHRADKDLGTSILPAATQQHAREGIRDAVTRSGLARPVPYQDDRSGEFLNAT